MVDARGMFRIPAPFSYRRQFRHTIVIIHAVKHHYDKYFPMRPILMPALLAVFSLPAGWFLGSRLAPGGVRSPSDRSFLKICRGITVTGPESACDRHYPRCAEYVDR